MTNNLSQSVVQMPLLSASIEDRDTYGVVVEVSLEQAGMMGAFVEDALSPEDAWESQVDIEPADDADLSLVMEPEGVTNG